MSTKYILAAGWKPYDEWNDFVIGIHDNWQEAIGHAYNYLNDLIEHSHGDGPLRNSVQREDGKTGFEPAKFKDSDKYVFVKQLVAISGVYDIHDEAGYWLEIVERQHEEHDWKGDLSDIIGDYVRIFTFDDEKEKTDEEME